MSAFLNIPLEIRNDIYRHLLHQNTGARKSIQTTDTVSLSHTLRFVDSREMNVTDLDKWAKNWSFNAGAIQLLHVCRQTAREGSKILYGEHRFASRDVRGFHEGFAMIIGPKNLRQIRRLYLENPLRSSGDGSFLVFFFTTDMPALAQLELSDTVGPSWLCHCGDRGRRGALLELAAAIAHRSHPTLRQAQWSEHATGYQEVRIKCVVTLSAGRLRGDRLNDLQTVGPLKNVQLDLERLAAYRGPLDQLQVEGYLLR